MRRGLTVGLCSLIFAFIACAPSIRSDPSPSAWLQAIEGEIVKSFKLKPGSVVATWQTEEPSPQVLNVRLDSSATMRLGYVTGEFPTHELHRIAWRWVPETLAVRQFAVTLWDINRFATYTVPAARMDEQWSRRK